MLISRSAIMANGKNLGAAISAPCSWGKRVSRTSATVQHVLYSFSCLLDVGAETDVLRDGPQKLLSLGSAINFASSAWGCFAVFHVACLPYPRPR